MSSLLLVGSASSSMSSLLLGVYRAFSRALLHFFPPLVSKKKKWKIHLSQGEQVASARQDGQAVLGCARLLWWCRARLLGCWQDARRPPEVGQGLDPRALPVCGLQYRLEPRLDRLCAGVRVWARLFNHGFLFYLILLSSLSNS